MERTDVLRGEGRGDLWGLVRKWEESEEQDAGRQQGWREARVEGEMEKCLALNKDAGQRKTH